MAKHDEYNNQEGLDPKVKGSINRAVRANRRQAKVDNARTKTTNEDGNGGRR